MPSTSPTAGRGTTTSSPPGRPAGPVAGLRRMEKGQIRRVVALGSGKGGVGKSSTAALVASELCRKGLAVGVLDADVTGPSQPKLFGLSGPLVDKGEGIEPAVSSEGIKMVSSQFLVEDEQTPVIWRGPLVTRLIQQFFGGVNWGKLDYLVIDMPPGTSDVPLTVFQTIPLDGMVFVFTPQELAGLIVTKAMNMARDLHVPLLGIVENFSFLTCPHCHERIEPFGPSGVAKIAERYGVPVLGRLPLDPALSLAGDAGKVGGYTSADVTSLANEFVQVLDAAEKERVATL